MAGTELSTALFMVIGNSTYYPEEEFSFVKQTQGNFLLMKFFILFNFTLMAGTCVCRQRQDSALCQCL